MNSSSKVHVNTNDGVCDMFLTCALILERERKKEREREREREKERERERVSFFVCIWLSIFDPFDKVGWVRDML